MKTTRSDIDRAAFQTFFQNNEPDFGRTALFEGDIERKGNETALRERKEVNSLEQSPSERKTIQHQFDRFAKMVLAGEANKRKKELARRSQYETTFSELSPQDMAQLYAMDEYPSDNYSFCVAGQKVIVRNDLIGKALSALPEQKRDIILLSYFLEMPDGDIGEKLNLVRSTIQYQRTSTLKSMKKYMEETADE